MKKINLSGLLAIIYFVFNYESSIGQPYPFSEEGYNYPVHTNATYPPIKVLVISVQLNGTDALGRDCDGWITPCFPENSLPVSIDDYFDASIGSGGPQGFITKYFHDASFGNFIVLGDYLDVIVNVPYCGASQIPEKVNQILFDTYGLNLPFHHGSALSEFDKYSLDALPVKGYPKVVAPNSRFDHVIYLTRNNPAWGWATGFGCAQTSILANVPGQSIGPMGVDVGCAFGHDGGIISLEFVLSEYFHAIFGHNNWHSGSGAGLHPFMTRTQPWGICTQVAGAGMSNVVSGWDRWWLGWNNPPDKLDLISARDNSNTEVNTDLSIPLTPDTNTYVLRDFVSTGDAIRIKIPHFNWQAMQDKKNQYIWLENHQLTNSLDQNILHTSSTTSICGAWADCGDSWAPGIYSMIQVGKDQKQASPVISDIYVDAYTSTPWHPNVLASWLYPLTATGNHDYKYTTLFPPPWDACLFGNGYILQDRQTPSNTKPNPFTGFSDLFSIDNTNGSTQLGDAGDHSALGYLDQNGTQIVNKLNKGGLETAFRCNGPCPATGKKILSLSTNPSSAPVLTYKSKDNHAGGNLFAPESFENRTILLSGLSVTILEENYNPALFGLGAVKMQIRWDDYDVENDVRWCADKIHLSPNDFNSNNYSLVIKNGSKLLIVRGGSPT